ncbi:hypothetical protein LCGC14_1698230, partial [marine sediment metagenome]
MAVAFRPKLCPKCERHGSGNLKDVKMLQQERIRRPFCKRPPNGTCVSATFVLHAIDPYRHKDDCEF